MFPEIHTIQDILPFIEGKEEFKVNDKGDYIVIDYVVSKEDTFDSPQAKESRGIKFYSDGRIASRPLHKFMNRGECPEEENKWFTDDFRMFLKLDGSLIHPFKFNDGKIRLMTKAGVTDVSELCEQECPISYDFWSACEDMIDLGLTPMFEYCSPNNRIVIPYEEPSLTLIAVRDNVTGEYFHLDQYADVLGVPRVPEITDPLSQVKEWKDREGVVLVWDNGYRLKVKADEYVIKHRVKDSLIHEKNVLAMVLNDSVDDLAGILDDEDYSQVREYHDKVTDSIWTYSHKVSEVVNKCQGFDTRKEQAEYIKQSDLMPAICFQVLDGKSPEEATCGIVEKHLTNQTKVDKVREIIGANWSY